MVPAQRVERGVIQVHSLSLQLAVEDVFITVPFRVSDVMAFNSISSSSDSFFYFVIQAQYTILGKSGKGYESQGVARPRNNDEAGL